MKTTLLSLKAFFTICLLCLVGGVNVMADTYEVPFVGSFKKGNTTATIDNHVWTLSKKCTYAATTDGGLQLGSSNNPMKDFSLTATDYKGIITKITVNAYAKSTSPTPTISVSVGGVNFKGENTLPTQWENMVFTGNAQGDIVLNINANKQFYLKSITIEYSGVAVPTIDPASKKFSESFVAKISCTDAAAKIYYTLDGNTPDKNSTLYTETGVNIPKATTTLKAVAIKDGIASSVTEAVYTLTPPTPTIDQASKTFFRPFVAKISCTDANAKIYYTLDGNTPDENSTLYTETGVTIPEATTTLKAVAIKDGVQSEIAEVVYTYIRPNSPVLFTIWSEDWSSFLETKEETPNSGNNAAYTYGTGTKLFFGTDDNYAGGEVPELLIKPNTSFTINVTSLKGYSGTLYFSFLTNKEQFKVESTTLGVNIGTFTKDGDNKYTYTITVPEGTEGLNLKITNTGKNMRVDNLELYAEKTGSFTITPARYGTYYTEDAFVMPEGVTGYTITSEDGQTLNFNGNYVAGKTVPAKTALLLKADEKLAANKDFTYTIVNSDEVAPTDNLLHGSVENATTNVEGAKAYYKLANPTEEGLGFYYGAENGAAFTNGAHKAYLAVMTETLSQMRGFSFDSMTTGINHVVANAEHAKTTVIYDLNGRRVNSLNAAAKGVYIVNGKKVIVK